MKKLIAVMMVMGLMFGYVQAATTIKGEYIQPTVQTYGSLYTAEATVWSNSSNLGNFVRKAFIIKNTSPAQTINATIEVSINKTDWVTLDATTFSTLLKGTARVVRFDYVPLPWWRIRANGGGAVATVESSMSATTN